MQTKIFKKRILPDFIKQQYLVPIVLFLILALISVLYISVFKNSLTNWDDSLYVLYNPYITGLSTDNLKAIFSTYYAGNYHPLTLISMALDYKLGGVQPWPYQLTNLILHLCNVLLVYAFVKSLLNLNSSKLANYKAVAIMAAFLFGIHTLEVESVVWVSERKNVLYAFFFLSSLIFYCKYLANKTKGSYILSAVLFIFSLLSKGMAMPLSLCLIAIDYFADRNLLSKKVILEKIPFLLLSLVFGIIAIFAQHSGEAISLDGNFTWGSRIAIASYGFIQYLVKLIFPFQLSSFYPYPVKPGAFLPFQFYVSIGLVSALIFVLCRFFRHNKLIIFSSLFFVANISIVIQLLPVGDAFMADRYAYIPSIGFFLIAGYYLVILLQKFPGYLKLTASLLIIYCTIISISTFFRVGIWKDSLTLWNDAIKKFPENNDRGYLNRGNIYFEMGKFSEAFQDYNKLLKTDPHNSGGYIGMARIKQAMNDKQGAMNDFNTALAYKETYEGYIDRAVLRIELQDWEGALSDLDKAYQINPFRTGVYVNKGFIFYQLGNYSEALKYYSQALQIDANNYNATAGRALVKQAMQDMEGALGDFNNALSIRKTYEGFLNRAALKISMNDFTGASVDLDYATQFNPSSLEVLLNRGVIALNTGNNENALQIFNSIIEMNNNSFQAYLFRAIAKSNLNDYKGAIVDFDISIKLTPNADAFYYRGITKIKSGNKPEGCDDLNQSLKSGKADAQNAINEYCK